MSIYLFGERLGRAVWVLERPLDVHEERVRQVISVSLVLLVSDEKGDSDLDLLLSVGPLGVFVAGPGVCRQFDCLLRALSVRADQLSVMSGFFDAENLGEAFDEFMVSALPSAERWDEWLSYVIVPGSGAWAARELHAGLVDKLNGQGE